MPGDSSFQRIEDEVCPVVGIDFGTTNSRAAVLTGRGVQMVPNAFERMATPSRVQFLSPNQTVTGEAAAATPGRQDVVLGVKRLLGRTWEELAPLACQTSCDLIERNGNFAGLRCQGHLLPPQFIAAIVLKSLKADAERLAGTTITKAVMTVPACFDIAQQKALKQAAEMAGLEVLRIIRATSGAALAAHIRKGLSGTVAIVDLGGGSASVAIVDLGDGVVQAISNAGDGHLGGDDIDQRLVDFICEYCRANYNLDPSKNGESIGRIREVAHQLKCELSAQMSASAVLPYLADGSGRSENVSLELTRTLFQTACAVLFGQLRSLASRVLRDAELAGAEPVGQVLLVGGGSRLPGIANILQDVFRPQSVLVLNGDEDVALGAALFGAVLSGVRQDFLLIEATAASLGLERRDGSMAVLLPRGSTIPTRSSSQGFEVSSNGGKTAPLKIYEGEAAIASDNKQLGTLSLVGCLPENQPGSFWVDVCVDLDAGGSLNVVGTERTSGRESHSTLGLGTLTGLSSEDASRLAEMLPP